MYNELKYYTLKIGNAIDIMLKEVDQCLNLRWNLVI